MMPYEYLEVSAPETLVGRLELRRVEKKNALCMALRDELEEALAALAADDEVNVVVLAGAPGIFSAGYDLGEGMATGGKAFGHRFREFYEACYRFPKLVVAAVDGLALGGGFDLALMADFIVASERAQFGHPEIGFGPVAMTPLARFLTPMQARQVALFGRRMGAAEARSLGLVHEIVPDGEADAAATRLAAELAAWPVHATQLTKRAVEAWTTPAALLDADEAAVRQALDVTGA